MEFRLPVLDGSNYYFCRMALKPGDKVSFIDEVGGGIVLDIRQGRLLLHREDGFDEWVPLTSVVKRGGDDGSKGDVALDGKRQEKQDLPEAPSASEDRRESSDIREGDMVSFLDEQDEAVVLKIKGSSLFLRRQGGFEEWVERSSVVIKGDIKVDRVVSKDAIAPGREENPRKGRKEKHIMEVDLHIHELVEFPARMTNYEMLQLQLETARRAIDKARSSFVKKLILIHGVGEGKLRSELHQMLSGMDRLNFHDASFVKYGAGATEIELV